jgi:hypothetical protein
MIWCVNDHLKLLASEALHIVSFANIAKPITNSFPEIKCLSRQAKTQLFCTKTNKTLSVPQKDHLLFVTGDKQERESEVVDIREDSAYCRSLPDYPLQAHYASGGILNRQPLICGGIVGVEESNHATNECYVYDVTSLTWALFANMTHKRYGASGVALDNNRFLIMGGSGQTNANSTSEYIFSNHTVVAGPIIPFIGLEWHCLVRLDDGKVIIISQFKG